MLCFRSHRTGIRIYIVNGQGVFVCFIIGRDSSILCAHNSGDLIGLLGISGLIRNRNFVAFAVAVASRYGIQNYTVCRFILNRQIINIRHIVYINDRVRTKVAGNDALICRISHNLRCLNGILYAVIHPLAVYMIHHITLMVIDRQGENVTYMQSWIKIIKEPPCMLRIAGMVGNADISTPF